MSEPVEQRLTELEIKLTFVDDTVRALAQADADQSLRLAVLERTLRDVRRELSSLRLAQADDPHGEPPPPHY
ncbi:MAG: SlyX family protein [Rhodanobacter sp.]